MKKYVYILFVFALVLSLCACGNPETAEDIKDPSATETVPPVTETEVPESPAPTPAPAPSPSPEESAAVILTDADSTGLQLPEDKICVVDEEGMQILITFKSDAKQVRLCSPVYDDDFNYLGTGDILLAVGSVKAGDEFGLRVYIPDVLPNVVLCYSDAQGEHVYGIFQSGEDGSLLLVKMQRSNGIT